MKCDIFTNVIYYKLLVLCCPNSGLCTYEKKVACDITINLPDGNHGNQDILEMLTGVVLWWLSYGKFYLYMSNSFIYCNKCIKLCNDVVWLNKE